MINQLERIERGLGPNKLDPTKVIEFFDPITRAPKVWYFIDNDGSYDFYDQPGFHPVYWEELKPITKDIVLDLKKRAKQIEEETKEKKLIEKKEKRQMEEEKRRQEKIAANKTYIEKHINPIISNDPSMAEIAVFITKRKTMNSSQKSRIIGEKIVEELTKENINAVSNLFKNEFITTGKFKNLYQGEIQSILDLKLENYID